MLTPLENLELSANEGEFQAALVSWYLDNRRDLPWRRTSDPYAIWVSEVMLQQTQVATVVDYWNRWMRRFPTVGDLARADIQEVLAQWQGLGYYRRCRSLHEGAKIVASEGIPTNVEGWKRLPGIGDYTAGAIASISQGTSAAVVDGNVERVYARLTANASSTPDLRKNTWKWASTQVPATDAGTWNQALMELGATVCTFANPECDRCPIHKYCKAAAMGNPTEFPISSAKPAVNALSHVTVAPLFEGKFGVEQIPRGQWWEGMWQFPRDPSGDYLQLTRSWDIGELISLSTIKHTVTNNRISLKLLLARLNKQPEGLQWHGLRELEHVPMPAPQRRAVNLVRRSLCGEQGTLEL